MDCVWIAYQKERKELRVEGVSVSLGKVLGRSRNSAHFEGSLYSLY